MKHVHDHVPIQNVVSTLQVLDVIIVIAEHRKEFRWFRVGWIVKPRIEHICAESSQVADISVGIILALPLGDGLACVLEIFLNVRCIEDMPKVLEEFGHVTIKLDQFASDMYKVRLDSVIMA